MAFAISSRVQNVVGNRREEYLTVITDATSGTVQSKLSWIESIDVVELGGSDRIVDLYPNSTTASLTEDDPGHFFIGNCAAVSFYVFQVIGR